MDEAGRTDSARGEPAARDFELLVVRYLDGLCSVEEARLLSDQLAASAQKRNQFAALAVQIGVLAEMAISQKSPSAGIESAALAGEQQASCALPIVFPDSCNSADDLAGLGGSTSLAQSTVGRILPGGRRWLIASRWRAAWIGLTVAVLVAGVFWMRPAGDSQLYPQREPQLIASLKNGAQAKWRDGLLLPDGAQFSEGQVLELAGGQAQVSMSCGAEVVLRAPCSIKLTKLNQLLLREGLVCVQLADWTNDFTVATESVQILDLGKQFVVSADASTGAVEAHAIDGKLRIQSTNVPAERRYGLLVTAGEAIRIQPASNTSIRLKADGSLFDPSLDDSRPYKPVKIHNTGRGLTPGDEDLHWRIVNSSADDFGGPRYAVTCGQYSNCYLANEPAVSQWISVSNPVDDNCPPNTMYTFETEFDLSGYDLATVTVVAHVLADNGVTGVRINGRPVAFKPWMAVLGLFDTYRKVEITGGFVDGVNRIEFDVWNSIVTRDVYANNPMALRVEWQAFGRLKPRESAHNGQKTDAALARRQQSAKTNHRLPL